MSATVPRRRAAHPARGPWLRPGRRVGLALWTLLLLGGLVALGFAAAPDPPPYAGEIGGVAVALAFTTGLVARTGGRTLVYGFLSLLLGTAVVVTDETVLRTG